MESHRSYLSRLRCCWHHRLVSWFCVKALLESTPAMGEVQRQTRTLKFALEAHVAKIVESHSILKWIPTMAADAISFFRIGRGVLTAEMRRSGRAWKKLVADFGQSVHCRPAAARAVASGMQPKAVRWTGVLDTTRELAAFSS